MNNKLLYKIKPLTDRNIENIKNDQIWIPKASSLNDPYDCSVLPNLSVDIDLKELDTLLDALANEAEIFANIKNNSYYEAKTKKDKNWVAHKIACGIIQDVGVLSFIDTPNNIVTWSHYGDEHNGICMEYSPISEDPVERFKTFMGGYRFKSVSYTNKLPVCDWRDFLRAPEFVLETIFTTKYKDWAYENESRIVTYDHLGDTELSLNELGLKVNRIFLGCEIKKTKQLSHLESVCEKKKIPIVRLVRNGFSFTLSEQR